MKIKTSPRTDCKAMTLLEICIVVAILAVLAMLLFPLMKGVAERSKTASCAQKLRQISVLLHGVIADHNGKLQLFRDGSAQGSLRWYFQLRNYARLSDAEAQKAFGCPSLSADDIDDWNCYGLRAGGAPGKRQSITNEKGQKVGLYILALTAVPEPAKFPMMADTGTPGGKQTFRIIPPGLYSGSGIQIRHQNRANVLFLDGHVETLDGRGLYGIGFTEVLDSNGNPISTNP